MKFPSCFIIPFILLAVSACQFNNKNQHAETEEIIVTESKDTVEIPIFGIEKIEGTEIFEKINGVSYSPECPVPVSDLRHLKVAYVDFEGDDQQGEMVCHVNIAFDLLEIFRDLYETRYPIANISLIEDFDGDDEKSMNANNTSCFNCRQKTGVKEFSQHAYGLAVDINPIYNPYVRQRGDILIVKPSNSTPFVDRNADFPHKINKDDLCYKLFREHGFKWGGAWRSVKDYQHFEKPLNVNPELKNGDLLFQVGSESEFSNAITDATANGESLRFDHVAILSIEPSGEKSVIEASPVNGVVMTPLKVFLDNSVKIEGKPGVVVMRLFKKMDFSQIVNRAKAFLGQSYDWSFLPGNDKIYCSELVYESFLDDDSVPVFEARPMRFRNSEGEIPEFWKKLFENMGEEIPEGIPGTNPSEMSADPRLIEVYRYF